MADNVTITAGTGTTVSTEEVSTLNGAAVSAQHLQRTATAIVLSDGTAIDLPGDVTYGLDVDVTRISGTAAVSATNLDIRDLSYTSDSVTVYGTATVTATNLDVRDLTYVSDSVAIYGTATVTATDLDIRNLSSSQDSILVSGTVVSTANNLDIRDLSYTQDSVAIYGTATVTGTLGLTAGTGAPRPDNHGQTLMAKAAQYTTAVTGTAFWTPAAGKSICVTYFQIQASGTQDGDIQLWFGASGDSTYTRGTDAAIYDGHLEPSATAAPGIAIAPPVPFKGTADYVLRVTTSAAVNPLFVVAWGYEV